MGQESWQCVSDQLRKVGGAGRSRTTAHMCAQRWAECMRWTPEEDAALSACSMGDWSAASSAKKGPRRSDDDYTQRWRLLRLKDILGRLGASDWSKVLGEYRQLPGCEAAALDDCRDMWIDSFTSRRCIEVDVLGQMTVLVQEEPYKGCFVHGDRVHFVHFEPMSYADEPTSARCGDAVRLRLTRPARPTVSLFGPAQFHGELVKLL